MPELIFKIIASSESDEKFPPGNLITGKRPWRGKAGVEFNYVILKLPREEELRSIDIGNDGSAYVSVSVARSCEDIPTYNCLISETAFMDPGDCRMERHLHRVKMFDASQMNAAFSNDKWDLIKIVCKQPYNKRIPYGLRFVQLIGGDENKPTTPATKLGTPISLATMVSTSRTIFDEVENQLEKREQQIKNNELVEREQSERMQRLKEDQMEKARLIRAQKRSHQDDNDFKEKDVPICTANGIILDSKGRAVNSSPSTSRTPQPTQKLRDRPSTLKDVRAPERQKNGNAFTPSAMLQSMINASSPNTKKDGGSYLLISPKRRKIPDGGNPATQIAEAAGSPNAASNGPSPPSGPLVGVTFSLSGFENPLRGDLRKNGVSLGAIYTDKIDGNLTHLVCAFKNTPKARKARPSVKLVSQYWIEQCFDQKRRLREELYKI